MITLYTGTPGSGKSLMAAREITSWLKTFKKNVIANINIDRSKVLKGSKGGRFFYVENDKLTTEFLEEYAIRYHDLGKESQTLVVIDEAQVLFSSTTCKLENENLRRIWEQDQKELKVKHMTGQISKEEYYEALKKIGNKPPNYKKIWLDFFTQHRHLGFDFLIITQFDKLIDAQFRYLTEYNYVHRKANNFGFIGMLFTIFHINLFCEVQYWYQANQYCSKRFYTYKKKYGEIYDSYNYRNFIINKLTEKYGEEYMQSIMGIGKRSRLKKVINFSDNKSKVKEVDPEEKDPVDQKGVV